MTLEITIPGVLVATVEAHEDIRGRFVEIMRTAKYPGSFAQSNHSHSKEGVLRGLHYHRHQADLWYVVSGRAQVGLVDLRARAHSPRSMTLILERETPTTVYIPPGVAHGFLALTDVDLIYWVTREYDASDEYGIAWNDPTLGIEWQSDQPVISERDATNARLDWDSIPDFSKSPSH